MQLPLRVSKLIDLVSDRLIAYELDQVFQKHAFRTPQKQWDSRMETFLELVIYMRDNTACFKSLFKVDFQFWLSTQHALCVTALI